METMMLTVPGMTCGHCESAVTTEVSAVVGVESVDVNLDTKLVTITGESLDREALEAAVEEAGFDVEPG